MTLDVPAAAKALLQAYRTGEPVEPLAKQVEGLDIDGAYAIQLAQVEQWLAGGAVVKGHKVGLTSAAMQQQLGVDQPDFGHLTDGMFHSESEVIDISAFLQPRVEPEIGFILGKPLSGPGVTLEQVADAVEWVVPSLEIIDSRVRDWKISIVDTIADNASSGGLVLGTARAKLSDVDVVETTGSLKVNDSIVGTGKGSAVLGNPLSAVAWLANVLGERGVSLEAGHVVLPGSITAAVAVSDGDEVVATFDGLGTVTARFGKVSG
ncbi:2-keto-4-pentenoate hydratase [Kibdelosporangium philippinense]|uniref:2-keto-4-pentenoate hydratase n=1 Tax=Kibdelosporangium philippinense TaxID=211113 RepID=A0ABS8ZEW1_9PSEU|nr:2-keto-4-pentenoate hydratase [Kibdelosporangium philippinense]MCE7004377.1 2-keto-4-pentenoate hydratase [Kibdelosporangium philippinense]